MGPSKDALTSIDSFGGRIDIVPAEVHGYFRRWRTVTQAILIFIFLALPWTKVNGSQTVLLDIVHRKFALFGLQFWSHDGPLIFFVVAFLALTLGFMTALWGRVWCGWACPQTVFIDGVYRQLEIWIEGNYIQRRRLRKAPLSFAKASKWLLKWISFTLVSSIISHSFIAYFVGADYLLTLVQGSPLDNWNYFLLITAMTGLLMFNFGWFREQFCLVVCPYGRFQSVLMDSNSVTVLYDEKRGEPRKGSTSVGEKTGDCVACRRCVEVCPTGIDIRKGVQMECIACTSCMDACDEIMEKVKKPKGLIRYSSLYEKPRLLRPRILVYLALMVVVGVGLGFNFTDRSAFMVTLLRAKETPYQVMEENNRKEVLNHFKLHLHNQSAQTQTFEVGLAPEFLNEGIKLTLPPANLELPATMDRELHFFVLAPMDGFDSKGQLQLSLVIKGSLDPVPVVKPMMLIGPEKVRP